MVLAVNLKREKHVRLIQCLKILNSLSGVHVCLNVCLSLVLCLMSDEYRVQLGSHPWSGGIGSNFPEKDKPCTRGRCFSTIPIFSFYQQRSVVMRQKQAVRPFATVLNGFLLIVLYIWPATIFHANMALAVIMTFQGYIAQ